MKLAPQEPAAMAWPRLSDSFTGAGLETALTLAIYLLIGGLLAVYVRTLYSRTSRNPAADSVARVFPLLTLVTITVISVVKTSLALSLGLVGALSIVRFRAAIKDPEELVYLFLCIGIGLALGAEAPWLALVLVVVATLFVLVFDRMRSSSGAGEGFLTVVGPASRYLGDGAESALGAVRRTCPNMVVQRCEVDGGEGQLRVQLRGVRDGDAPNIVGALRTSLPDCHISFVDGRALA